MSEQPLIPYLFRTEFAKIVAVLCKTYGFSNVHLAEDIVSETFLKASETWGLKGVPQNPKAWLYLVAKNKTKDHFKHAAVFNQKIVPELKANATAIVQETELDLSDANIQDSQLRMLFVVCNPKLTNEAQITLALRLLCGFGVDEIENALLTTKATINKRLFRAKEKIRKIEQSILLISEAEFKARLPNVLVILYLLFNEGYYSSSPNKNIRKELCIEAMGLLFLLLRNNKTNVPEANALMALFCFHSSRFDARIGGDGETILYADQDQKKWIPELIAKGTYYLNLSAKGEGVTKYHIEASIAFWHTQINIEEALKWEHILQLYNRLLQIEYSPIIALNRTYALSKVKGKAFALKEALKINLEKNHLYHSLIAELYGGRNEALKREHLEIARKLAPNKASQNDVQRKLNNLHP